MILVRVRKSREQVGLVTTDEGEAAVEPTTTSPYSPGSRGSASFDDV